MKNLYQMHPNFRLLNKYNHGKYKAWYAGADKNTNNGYLC